MKYILILSTLVMTSCGQRNIFDCKTPLSGVSCNERTKDEDARIALDEGDLDEAVKLLKELVSEDPENYSRYPLLAAALAGRSGFDIFNIVKANFGSSTSLLEIMGDFLPTPTSKGDAYDESLSDMDEAVTVLKSVPESLRQDIAASNFAASCALQLTLYQSAYSIMLINKYSYGASGYDPSQLANMTAEDAAAILSNLLGAGSVVTGDSGEAASQAVNAAYAEIQSQPGTNDQEKIAAYVQSHH